MTDEKLNQMTTAPLADQIANLCQPYIQARGSLDNCMTQPLYRGMQVNGETTIYDSQPYREPKFMPIVLHHRIDQWFHDRYGHCFRSANVVFCTGSRELAKEYDNVCAIFPIGEFKFVWSPKVSDLAHYIGAKLNKLTETSTIELWSRLLGYSDPNSFSTEERALRAKAIALCGDILKEFECEHYFYIDNLNKAVSSGCEIMLVCQQYLALPVIQNS